MSLTCRVITLLKFYHKTETIPTDHHTTPTTPPPQKKEKDFCYFRIIILKCIKQIIFSQLNELEYDKENRCLNILNMYI